MGVIVRCDDHATVARVLVEKTSRCQLFNVNGSAAKTRPKAALALKASRQAGGVEGKQAGRQASKAACCACDILSKIIFQALAARSHAGTRRTIE